MIWSIDRMIECHRQALLRVVAGLFVMAEVQPGGSAVMVLPRAVRNAILFVLRPVESAVRRLVFARARDIVVPEYHARPRAERTGSGPKTGERVPLFRLIDPRKLFEALYPHRRPRKATGKRETEPRLLARIGDVAIWSDPAPAPEPDDPVDAVRLCRRMQAVLAALEDMPKQAQRMAHLMARRAKAPAGPGRVPPLRPGLPPGYRQRWRHPVDEILWECHCLAMRDPAPDTS